jgi:hypothetical protein
MCNFYLWLLCNIFLPNFYGVVVWLGSSVLVVAQLMERYRLSTYDCPEFAEWSAAYKSLRGES